MKDGLIILLPKEGDTLLIENWRPITLLNTDRKLLAKILARRLALVMPAIVSSCQTGGVKGRNISDTSRFLADIFEFLQTKLYPGILLQLDLKKAFDKIEWSHLLPFLMPSCLAPLSCLGFKFSWLALALP